MLTRSLGVFRGSLVSRMNGIRLLSTKIKDFDTAVEASTKLPEEPSNEMKLKLYALFKQATIGQNETKKPGMLDIVGKYKWEAWNALSQMSKADAEKKYIDLVNELGGSAEDAVDNPEPQDPIEDNSVAGLSTKLDDGVLTLRLNNPRRKNPVTTEIYETIGAKLREHAANPRCKVAVLTGTGDYYSSGNDLSNFATIMAKVPPEETNPKKASAELGRKLMVDFQRSIIEFPKPLIALVNGPAVGIMVTTLALFDAVLASENATFSTPFASLAQSPEGCSTATFPLAMGPLVASDVLLFGRVLTAEEAGRYGLVSRVIPANSFGENCNAFIKHAASLPTGAMQASKRIIRGNSGQPMSMKKLLEVSEEESHVLANCWQSEECESALMNFFSRKSGSKL